MSEGERADDPVALVAEARAIATRWANYSSAIGHLQPEPLRAIASDALPLLDRLATALAEEHQENERLSDHYWDHLDTLRQLDAARSEAAALRETIAALEALLGPQAQALLAAHAALAPAEPRHE